MKLNKFTLLSILTCKYSDDNKKRLLYSCSFHLTSVTNDQYIRLQSVCLLLDKEEKK